MQWLFGMSQGAWDDHALSGTPVCTLVNPKIVLLVRKWDMLGAAEGGPGGCEADSEWILEACPSTAKREWLRREEHGVEGPIQGWISLCYFFSSLFPGSARGGALG